MNTTKAKAYAAQDATSALTPFDITRREPGPLDVEIEILYCGVCHSDVHTLPTKLPMVCDLAPMRWWCPKMLTR